MRCCPSKPCWLAWFVLLATATGVVRGEEPAAKEDVSFTAKCDQSVQKYLVIFPAKFSDSEPHHLLIILHGHGSDRWQALDDKVNEFRAARDAATARNILVVSPDYRAKTSWMGPKAEADLQQILDEVKAKYRIEKVVVSGASMGGSSALTFAALHPELVDGVVSMNGTANHIEYENFQDAIKKSFGGSKADIPLEYKKRSAEYWPERFTMPVAITAGGKDNVVPAASVLRLAEAIKKLKPNNVLVVHRDEGGHNTNYEDSKAAFDFVLDRVIKTPRAIDSNR